MRPLKLTGYAVFAIVAAVSTGRSDDQIDPFAPTDSRLPKLISLLSDADPLVRTDAVQRLTNLGDAARPSLRQAIFTATPQVRAEIDQVLMHVPWVKTGDSDAVEQAFTGYADLDPESRCVRIDNWLAPLQDGAAPGLLRILLNDPSTAVRWEAASKLIMDLDANPTLAKQLLELVDGAENANEPYLPPSENAPLLAAAGWGCRAANPNRATDLMLQAVHMEQDDPSAFIGQMDFAYLWLVDRATLDRNHARVVELLRQQANRTAWNVDRVPDAVASLFAEQAEFGPFAGFSDDLRTYREYFTHPELVYTMAKLARRQGHPLAADAMETTALLMSGDSADEHYMAGAFLASHNWNSPAEREFKWALHLTNGNVPAIYFQLSALADQRDDDLASAHYMESGLQKLADSHGLVQANRNGDVSPWNPDDGWAEVHWHYLRAARDANDTARIKLHLDKLMSMDQDQHILDRDPGMAADIVPALQGQGRNDQADQIFDAAYISLKAKMDAAADDPMPKNNLAWLCACSGKRLDEAVKLSTQAVAQDPEDAACLDTQAESFYRTGQPAKSVEIETHALLIKPDDVYMKKQFEKFKKAADAKAVH